MGRPPTPSRAHLDRGHVRKRLRIKLQRHFRKKGREAALQPVRRGINDSPLYSGHHEPPHPVLYLSLALLLLRLGVAAADEFKGQPSTEKLRGPLHAFHLIYPEG